MEGLVHFYTGDGKGKTTAAIGLAVRAAGAGRKVVFAQFMKGMDTSELAPLKTLGVQVVRKGTVTKFVPYMTEDERALCAAQQAETLAALDLHQALTISSVSAWCVWLLFLLLAARGMKKSSGKSHAHGV